jgi:tetratricopeptide (TPR) repeat protein
MQSPSATPAPRASILWKGALILGLALVCYWPALRGDLVWDDDAHVTKPELRSAAGLVRIWTDLGATQQYYPVLHSAFWVEHKLWGDAVLGYHLTNLVLHVTSALLLVVILRRLRIPGAWLAGLVFAVHPVCVESVAWISEQKNTLSLVLYLAAALAYVRFEGRRGRPGARGAYILATALFISAILAKTVAATLPAALLVMIWWQHGRIIWRRDVLPLVPWFSLAAAGGLFTAMVERIYIGAVGSEFDLTAAQRLALAGRAVWFYIGKLAWPSGLVQVYPRWDVKSEAAGWAFYVLAAALVTAALWALRGRMRGPLAAWLFFVGSLFPALGLVNVYYFEFSYVADHFQYLACLGLITAASAGCTLLLGRATPSARTAGWGAVTVIVAALCFQSNERSRTFSDKPTFYSDIIARNPGCWVAHNNLGHWYADQGDSAKAIAEYREAIHLKADYASAYNNLGVELAKVPGQLDGAIASYEEALRVQPSLAEAHGNLGNALLKVHGRLNDAVAHFQEALRLQPDVAEAHNNLGNAWSRVPGRMGDAAAEYGEAIRLRPEFAEAHKNLGGALARMPGRSDEAISQFREALRLNPSYAGAHNDLGSALARIPGRLDEAIAQFREALRLQPGSAEAHNNLGAALNAQGRTPEAVAQFDEALRLQPNFAEAHDNLGNAFSKMPGRLGDAVAEYKVALRLNPGFAGAHNNLGTALNAQGMKAEAADQFAEALRLMPENAEIHYNLAIALLGIPGRQNEAAENLEAFLRARPGNEAAARILAQIRAAQP